MNARIRIHLALAAAALATLGVAGTAAAQTFPSKPVTLMVPYPAGGLSDVIARSVNNTLGKQLGQPVIVENLGGASGSIAAAKVLNGPSDGYTIFQGSPNELILAPLAISSIKFKSEDFRLVQMIATAQIAFLAKKDLPVNSVDEFVEHARKAAKDGKPLTFASVGPGSFYHLLGEHLSKVTGIPMVHVPYKGAAPALADLMGGQIPLFLDPPPNLIQPAKAGRIRLIGVASDKRLAALPDVPTFVEQGYDGLLGSTWAAMIAPAGVPREIVQRMSAEVSRIIRSAEVSQRLEQVMGTFAEGSTPEECDRFIAAETEKWGRVIREAKVTVD